jgi:hypothetical protein
MIAKLALSSVLAKKDLSLECIPKYYYQPVRRSILWVDAYYRHKMLLENCNIELV